MSETLAIASGKGGVGKTTISVNLALTQARSSNCLLLDADMGMANAHILLGINPKTSVRDVIEGSISLESALVKGPNNVKFLSMELPFNTIDFLSSLAAFSAIS